MRKHLLIIAFALVTGFSQAQIVNIPDVNFLKALIANNIDTNKDGLIQTSETISIKEIRNSNIKNVSGIEAFVALEFFDCAENEIETINVRKNTNLVILTCFSNQLKELDVSYNLKLHGEPTAGGLWCDKNPNLHQICINMSQLQNTNFWVKDEIASYSTTCGVTGIQDDNLIEPTISVIGIYNLVGRSLKQEEAKDGLYL